MTEYERMIKGYLYDPGDETILADQAVLLDGLRKFNAYTAAEAEKRQQYMKEVFASCGEECYIETPFYANWGGKNVHLGNRVYINFNATFVDDGHIFIGDGVMFGPNVTIATAGHPLDAERRAKGLQYNRDVHIGDNAWIGAGAILLPGVRIGCNTVIGAGSVVTKDIPDNVIAVGNPCRVLREINDKDRQEMYGEV